MKLLERKSVAICFIATGVVLIAIAIFARQLGLVGEGVKARAFAGLFGLLFLGIGLLRGSFTRLYVTSCVMLANTVLLLFVAEGFAMVFARYTEYKRSVHSVEMAEARRASGVVRTLYTGWKGIPSKRPTITILENGLRRTPEQTRKDHKPLRVFAFGGSTIWGEGATDEETIPAHLQRQLTKQLDYPVEVTNYGQRGWVSTQNLVQLMIELRSGNVPDVVVFYDGYNDGTASVKRGRVGIPENFEVLTNTESTKELSLRLFRMTSLGHVLTPQSGFSYPDSDPEVLATEMVKTYVAIQRIVIGAAKEFGFETQFYWQPQLMIGKKQLTKDEQIIHDTHRWLSPEVRQVMSLAYDKAAIAANDRERFTDISDVFDSVTETLYLDPCHVTGEANRLVALRMLENGVLVDATRQRDRLLAK